jgi:L-alanine-DL-glutamate epimerase-like enolase superfamily enzyme
MRAIKVKVDDDVPAAVARVAAVRRAAGSEIALRVDANGAWTPDVALAALAALAPYDLAFAEQPVAADRVADLAALRRRSPVPVAADEALLPPGGPERVLALEAADVLVLKPSLLGGLATAWSLASRACSLGMDVTVTSSLDRGVGIAGALHVAAALPRRRHACGLATGRLLDDDALPGPPVVDGRMAVPPHAGLGLVPSTEATGSQP